LIIKKIDVNKKFTRDYFRNYLAGIIQSLEKLNISNLIIASLDYPSYKKYFESEDYLYQSMLEGVYLGNYNYDKYFTKEKKQKSLGVVLEIADANLAGTILKISKNVAESVYFSRDLVNEPANILTPIEFAKRVKREFGKTSINVKIFNEAELKKRKMNAILSVGKGSTNRPVMIIAHYKPKLKTSKKICLVGKGVTYDTGGLSIKPTAGMLQMKADMAGGATVFGIIKAAELNKLPIEIMAIVPAVENSISGNSYKPGDVISTASGKTIEVKDTDAEGRIVLADALEFASKQKPDEIIDFATLTGAVAVALGLFTAGVFTKSDLIANKINSASKKTYEHTWRLPFWEEFNNLLESKIADVSNLGPRWGGAISAGKFLEHFVDEKIPYAHIDLAGPALNHDLTNYTKDYCTGFGVRLIFEYLKAGTLS
ncbi:MAG: leucyl aminopeptidase family protein, partial [Ignavibacteriae bacterium]|nr:leucyl aminopeptidase family protein [Ignavibacteriota bacterium]